MLDEVGGTRVYNDRAFLILFTCNHGMLCLTCAEVIRKEVEDIQ